MLCIVSQSNFFKNRKNYYLPETCKNSMTTPLRKFEEHYRWLHFRKIFLSVAETHAIFLFFHVFLWCSFANHAWSHGIDKRDNNKGAQKHCEYWFLLQGPRSHYQWRHHISRNSPGLSAPVFLTLRGRPTLTYVDQLQNDTGLSIVELKNIMENRKEWMKLVNGVRVRSK